MFQSVLHLSYGEMQGKKAQVIVIMCLANYGQNGASKSRQLIYTYAYNKLQIMLTTRIKCGPLSEWKADKRQREKKCDIETLNYV